MSLLPGIELGRVSELSGGYLLKISVSFGCQDATLASLVSYCIVSTDRDSEPRFNPTVFCHYSTGLKSLFDLVDIDDLFESGKRTSSSVDCRYNLQQCDNLPNLLAEAIVIPHMQGGFVHWCLLQSFMP